MCYSEEYKEHIEYTFNAFCKLVLRNAAINAYRDIRRKQEHEISLDYLISETSYEPFTTNTYFEQYDTPTFFVVKGYRRKQAVSRRIVPIVRVAAYCPADVLLSRLYRYADQARVRALQKHRELLEVSGSETVAKGMEENRT